MMIRKEILTVEAFMDRESKRIPTYSEECRIVMLSYRPYGSKKDPVTGVYPSFTMPMARSEFDELPDPKIGDELCKIVKIWPRGEGSDDDE